ncbi:MAG: hypothetical protein RIR26_2744 [Pseudomonadota bacterium]
MPAVKSNLKKNAFAGLALLALVLFALPAFAAFNLEMTLQPNPPQAGQNVFEVKVTDESGKPIEAAKLTPIISMPAMGTMPHMEARGRPKDQGNGNYLVDYELSMEGSWDVAITVEKGNNKETFYYSLTTGIAGLQDKNAKDAKSEGGTQASSGLRLGADRIQKIGVRFSEAKMLPMNKTVRAFGVVESDNTRRAEVVLRFQGYVEKQFKGRVGDHVKAGTPLFTVYSPELVAAQSEYLIAKRTTQGSSQLEASASDRLRNLGLSNADITAIEKSGVPKREITISAPQSGTLLEINAREGSGVEANQVLYVIGDLSKNFIVARVFQQDVANLRVGQPVEIQLTGDEQSVHPGQVTLLYPSVNEGAGTVNVRVSPNQFVRQLRPGVYADVRFPIELGTWLAIPQSALLHSGMHKYVFVDRGGGVLEPVEISIGKSTPEMVEVTSGLKAGDRVVSSGTFLLSSEAQLRSALPKWKRNATGAQK